ncbi:spore germination protein YaaH [Paenibacillus shirakamiensis]|uniref:Spore germination protein YaaH n=1 Tax=Paenibacillus shirakamiensis TaxID=1265935 RepID=A0ABS4JLA3_9BACL|nr:glycosyl hydrolase family 18 protein [Paenibacillus shirakamiensis]MBP2002490.1 spore germination protein YaaH [Paenibacillus shirakamiensis]
MRHSQHYRYNLRPKRRKSRLKLFCIVAFTATILIAGVFAWLPSTRHITPTWRTIKHPIFIHGELMKYEAKGEGKSLKLPLPVIRDYIDPSIIYEEPSNSVIMTTRRDLVQLTMDHTKAKRNNKSFNLDTAPTTIDEIQYIPVSLLEELYGIEVRISTTTGALLVMKAGEEIQAATLIAEDSNAGANSKPSSKDSKAKVPLRERESIHSPIVEDVDSDTTLRILSSKGDWSYVQSPAGYIGYIPKKNLSVIQAKRIPNLAKLSDPAMEKWAGKKINMTWEAVYQSPIKPTQVGTLPGVNVVSPTWFQLKDGEGNVQSKADLEYVTWAHKQGMQVWGLYSNGFNPDWTTTALSSFEHRLHSITQLIQQAKLYKLDGLNLDFENVYTKDKDNVTQFVRELMPMAKAEGLIISMDVTPKSNSEMWSKFLDRGPLGQSLDYMIVMAYDEHWAASPIAGSVASLPWVKTVTERILTQDHVPADKLILGIPLYARIWSETTKDGKTNMSSKAVGMNKTQEIIKKYALHPTIDHQSGQNYVEYTEDGALKKIWLEDALSLKSRVALAKDLKLAGVASWTRALASTEAWDALAEIIQ